MRMKSFPNPSYLLKSTSDAVAESDVVVDDDDGRDEVMAVLIAFVFNHANAGEMDATSETEKIREIIVMEWNICVCALGAKLRDL